MMRSGVVMRAVACGALALMVSSCASTSSSPRAATSSALQSVSAAASASASAAVSATPSAPVPVAGATAAPAASPDGAQTLPTSWVRVDVESGQATFLTWSISGFAITGTWQGVDLSGADAADSQNDTLPITGNILHSNVELNVPVPTSVIDDVWAGLLDYDPTPDASLVGTISPTSLMLHYIGPDADTSETLTFTPGSAAAYAAAVASLKQTNGGRQFDAAMKNDLREVANQMETYFTDNNMYPSSITSVSPGRLDVGGQTVQLTNGDVVSLEFLHADGEYCLIASNPTTVTRWMYDSTHG